VQLQVHAVKHRHARGKQAEPGKLATPRTTSHGVTPANRMDVITVLVISGLSISCLRKMKRKNKGNLFIVITESLTNYNFSHNI